MVWQLWQVPKRCPMPGARLARVQNWRVVGPRITVVGPTLPARIKARIVSYEHPGRKGCAGSRMNHGPMAFWVAWRESGSNSPPQATHFLVCGDTSPQ